MKCDQADEADRQPKDEHDKRTRLSQVLHHICYHDDMERTTISLPEQLLKRLRLLSAERGVSMAEVIREAIEETVSRHRPQPRSLGIGASGHTDTARRTGEERPEPRLWR